MLESIECVLWPYTPQCSLVIYIIGVSQPAFIRNSASTRLCWSVQLSSCTHFIILYPHPILSTHYLLFLNYKPPPSPAKFSSDYDTGAGQLPALMFLVRTLIHFSTIIYLHHRNTYLSLYRLFIKSPPLSPSSRPSEPQWAQHGRDISLASAWGEMSWPWRA